jgi:ribosome-associated translation inhibitor RaiA
MTDKQWEEKINNFLSAIEQVRDKHKFESAMILGASEYTFRIKSMHDDKAAAYDFVLRKLKRQFNLK